MLDQYQFIIHFHVACVRPTKPYSVRVVLWVYDSFIRSMSGYHWADLLVHKFYCVGPLSVYNTFIRSMSGYHWADLLVHKFYCVGPLSVYNTFIRSMSGYHWADQLVHRFYTLSVLLCWTIVHCQFIILSLGQCQVIIGQIN